MRDRERYILRRMETCAHFTGIQNDACKAGVAYATVRMPGLPCIQHLNDSPPQHDARRAACPKLELYTREQAEAEQASMEAHMGKTMRVLSAIKDWRTWTTENRVGKAEVIECPECKGRLHLSQSGYNGHVHGKCETADCVAWME